MPVMTSNQITLGLAALEFRSSGEVTLTSGVGVKGVFAVTFASTAIKTNWLTVLVLDPSTTTDYDIDIAVGAESSEVVLIPDIHYHVNLTGNSQISLPYTFKVDINAGTRMTARVLNAAAETIDVELILCGNLQ